MPPSSSGDHRNQKALLRAVYEENLHIKNRTRPVAEPSADAPPVERPARLRLPLWLMGLVVLVSVGVAGVLASDATSEPSATDPPPAEPVAGALIGPSDAAQLPRLEPTPSRTSGVPSLAELYGLEVRTIVIDPGHGGRDPGALGHSGTMEKAITLDVAKRLRDRLVPYGYRVVLTRTDDTFLSLRDRVAFAETEQADLFVSIHVNYLEQEPVTSIETYYFGPEGEASAATLRLAERENAGSDYSVAEFNELLRRIGPQLKLQESKRLADSIQKSMYRNMRSLNADVSDWGVKRAPFVVLLGETPSVLAEITCISNRAEEAKLATAAYRDRLAAFLEEGITNYLTDRPSPADTTDESTPYAQVQ